MSKEEIEKQAKEYGKKLPTEDAQLLDFLYGQVPDQKKEFIGRLFLDGLKYRFNWYEKPWYVALVSVLLTLLFVFLYFKLRKSANPSNP